MLDIDIVKNKLSDIRCYLSDHFGDKIWLKIGTDSTCKFRVIHVYDNTYRVGRGIADIYYRKLGSTDWYTYILPLNSDYDALKGRYLMSREFPNLYGFGSDGNRIYKIIEEMLDFKKENMSTPKEASKVSKYKVIGHTTKIDGSDIEFTVTVKPVISANNTNPWSSDRLNRLNTLYDELKDRIECESSTRVETALSCPTPNASIPGAESKSCKPFSLGIAIKEVKFNDPYTVVFWEDGKKTMVKCRKGDTYNKETGLALCIVKRGLGNRWGYYNIFKHWIPELKRIKNYAKEDYELYHKEKLTKEDLDETVIANLTLSEVSLDPGDAAQILKPYCDVKVNNSEKPEDNGNVNE